MADHDQRDRRQSPFWLGVRSALPLHASSASSFLHGLRLHHDLATFLSDSHVKSYFYELNDLKLGAPVWPVTVGLYAAIRSLRPRTVVETGVDWGKSSAVILYALSRNGRGELFSMDLPSVGRENGSQIPQALRANWHLELGDARHLLPNRLAELGQIDAFYHDSDHSDAHMTWEFETVWPHLSTGGLLLADDIDWSPAFDRFAKGKDAIRWVNPRPTEGAIRKR